MKAQNDPLYVTFDVEAAGPKLGRHPALSVGACVVSREDLAFNQYCARGLVFYAELKPQSLEYLERGMRVGCLHLECLEELRVQDARYDPTHESFDPLLTLQHMQKMCEEPAAAAGRFERWLIGVSKRRMVIPLTDTVFFDSGYINLWLGNSCASPRLLGYSGRDLKSLYQGFMGSKKAQLRDIALTYKLAKPHKADHDAVELAQKARIVLFEKMGW